ncbi:MAG: VWA domain-containing protein [Planctomycetes bacterium]|nr:VWA domain-containing protein [Planctomycetota bacterium]
MKAKMNMKSRLKIFLLMGSMIVALVSFAGPILGQQRRRIAVRRPTQRRTAIRRAPQRRRAIRRPPRHRRVVRRSANLVVPQSRSYSFTPNQETAVRITHVEADIHIVETVATTTLRIELENTTDSIQEAVLLLPVPDQAVVSRLIYSGPDWQIAGHILPKDVANRIYLALVSAIRDPALVEFAGYNLLLTRVFPIDPMGRRSVVLMYEHLLEVQDNRVDYYLPRTESLRYAVPWEITVNIEAAGPISTVYSPSHKVSVDRMSDTEVSVELDPDAETIPGPFQLSYLLAEDAVTASLFAYPDNGTDGGYFLLLVGLPASLPANVEPMKRELTVVLDRSGSMHGSKIEQAKDAARQIVSGLEQNEAFNLIIYNSIVQFFSDEPVLKHPTTEAAAHQYVDAVTADGLTNLYEALRLSLEQKPIEEMLPIILFLTDGLPTTGQTSEIAIRELVISNNPHNRRVFTFGVGFDVNAPLLQALAELSRARAHFVFPGENVEEAVGEVFRQLKGPVLSDTELSILDADGAEAVGRTWDILPAVLPDLFEGDRLILLGRYVGDQPLIFEISGNYLGEERSFSYWFDPSIADTRNAFVPRLWASRKIAELIDTIRQVGADPTLSRDDPLIKELTETIVSLSVEFGILTEYTAFLAEEDSDLYDTAQTESRAGDNLYARGACTRGGSGAVNQSVNMIQQRSQEVLNRDSSYLDEYVRAVRITNVQQISDLTFYHRGDRWVDSRLASKEEEEVVPDRTVDFGSKEFVELVEQLVAQNRQGCLSFAEDVLILNGGEIILVDMPEEARQSQDQPASCPNPPDGAVSVRIDPVLSWTAGADAESHNVYFGTANPPMFQVNQTAMTFAPGPLSGYTTYYWRIDEVSSAGTITAGPVWTFTAGTSGGTR